MEQNNFKCLGIEDSKLKWSGDLESLKRFIADELNLSGRKWSSPGGDVKVFTNTNTNIIESIDLDNTSQELNGLINNSHTSSGSSTKDEINSGLRLVSPDQPNINNRKSSQSNPNHSNS